MTNTLRIMMSLVLLSLLASCNEDESVDVETQTLPRVWWQSVAPDVVVGPREFYAGRCSITMVDTATGASELIFEISQNPFKSCRNQQDALTYDGEYIVLDVCEISFGAGGCGRGRYRSMDYENWEEDIGITWINGEEYEAWRKLGSQSSTADSVKKVIRD